jgi:hypothetical protein
MKKYVVMFDDAWRVLKDTPNQGNDIDKLEIPVVKFEDSNTRIVYGYESIGQDDQRWPEAAAYQLQRSGVRAFAMPEAARAVLEVISTGDADPEARYASIRELMHMTDEMIQELERAARQYATTVQQHHQQK